MSCNTPVSMAEPQSSTTSNQVRSVPTTSSSSFMDGAFLQEKVADTQTKIEKACKHIVQLDKKIKDLEVQYRRAVKHKKNSFRYNLRLRLSIVTGVKMMYHHYASTKAEELNRLHRQRNSDAGSNAIVRTYPVS